QDAAGRRRRSRCADQLRRDEEVTAQIPAALALSPLEWWARSSDTAKREPRRAPRRTRIRVCMPGADGRITMADPVVMGEAFALAAVLALAMVLALGKLSRMAVLRAGVVLAPLIAMFAGLWVLGLLPHWPPRDALDRLLMILLPAAAVAELIAVVSKW